MRSCSVDSSSFVRLKAVLAQFLLTVSLQKNNSNNVATSFLLTSSRDFLSFKQETFVRSTFCPSTRKLLFARLFVVQQGSSSREKKLKLDGHTQETSAWASTQETNPNPQRIIKEQAGGTTQWYLSLARSLALSILLVLSQKRKVSIILHKAHISTCGQVSPPSVLSPLLLPSAH